MKKVICQLQIKDRFFVNLEAKVFRVVASESRSYSMVVIEHGSDAIKSESVETEFFHPVAAVRKEESLDLPVPVVEDSRAPLRVVAPRAAMEEAAVGPVELV